MRKVLVIDDSALIRAAAQISLGRLGGWSVLLAESGAHGLDLAATERPDAVVLDVEMPGLDGPATLERLRRDEATRGIPVVFLTGKAEHEDRQRLIALGAVAVLSKPFDPAALPDQVAAALGWER
jgi:CheY-like chemotaxis protein